nr:MAG: RNA-dependent RNA polymerase [Porcine picobirnavirus]UAW00438.1 MAG: RNA-dependent RNA polymerase [Porcine picobirnavirus]
MDGLNFRAPSGLIAKYFGTDQYGLVYPRPDCLLMREAEQRLSRSLKAKTDLGFKLDERYYLTDVATTDNPLGNTNAITAGIPMFGKQPLSGLKFKGRMDVVTGNDAKVTAQLAKRQRRILQYEMDVLAQHAKQEPADKDSIEYVLWEIEHDQALTGGGFDNNHIGDVTKTAMKGMIKSMDIPEIADSKVSELFVRACLQIRDYLANYIQLGSLKPDGLSKVRFEQDNDGMFGFPVLKKGGAPLTTEIAIRLLVDSGVDTRKFVGSEVVDANTGLKHTYRIQDALGYILDNMTASPVDLISIIVFLARIQKHGYKLEDGVLVPKDGKARAVFPNSAVQACIEAMPINAFIRALQEAKVPCFPSIQDKPTRVEMIKHWMKQHSANGYGFLAADWSQYDATVPGWGLATIIQLVVKPFFNASYYNWLDAVTFILTYKYFLVNESLARINQEEFTECTTKVPNASVGDWRLFGLWNYLISGAKFTHIGGSLYGIGAVHLTIPALLGAEGQIGPQAGDDTLMAIPADFIHLDSKERTYEPIAKVAKSLGLDINPSKQIFYQYQGELVGIFLQDSYCEKGELWGIGTAYRPLAALFMSERNKGLTASEQEMATIARMNQGADNPFIDSAVELWFKCDAYLLGLVKERGASGAFQFLVDSIGDDVGDIAQRIEVGSFTYGVSKSQMSSGDLPILAVMDRVASSMQSSVSISKALKTFGQGDEQGTESIDVDTFASADEEDILDD